jgi:hypothetical protein
MMTHHDAMKVAKETERAVRAQKAAEEESKLLFVVTPKPWIDNALPFSTNVREAALVYKKSFETVMHHEFHDGVSFHLSRALIDSYVKARANWLSWSLTFGDNDSLPLPTGFNLPLKESTAGRPSIFPKSTDYMDAEIATNSSNAEIIDLTKVRPAYKLNARYTKLLDSRSLQVKMAIILDLESKNEIFPCPHLDLDMKALACALGQYLPNNIETTFTKDIGSFLSSLQTADLVDGSPGKAIYGFIDANNDQYSNDEFRVADIVDYVKSVIQQPVFEKQYLIALKDEDEDTLHMVLQYGSDWQHDILSAEICVEAVYNLKDLFSGYSLWQAGSMIFGSPENWPPYIRKAFARQGERKSQTSFNEDDDDEYESYL